MTGLWSFIAFALLLQETATADAALFAAQQAHLDLWVVHAVWAAATAVDIWIGFLAGTMARSAWGDTRIGRFAERWAETLRAFMGERGAKWTLTLLGLVNFPWANAFIAAWLERDYRAAFLFIFLGDALWYALEWAIVLGIWSVLPNPHVAIFVVIFGALALGAVAKWIFGKVARHRGH